MGRTQPHTVGGVMTTALHTVGPDHRLDLAALVMDEQRVRQLVVVDDDGALLGMVSYRALVKLVAAHRAGELGEGGAVSECMDPDPVSVQPTTRLKDAIRIMLDHQVSAVPVLDEGRVVGIVSEHDVMRMTAGLLELGPDALTGAS